MILVALYFKAQNKEHTSRIKVSVSLQSGKATPIGINQYNSPKAKFRDLFLVPFE